jgi:hypothetical protein
MANVLEKARNPETRPLFNPVKNAEEYSLNPWNKNAKA